MRHSSPRHSSPRLSLATRALVPLGRAARVACLAAGLAAPAAAQTFNFDTTPVNTPTPLSITSGGVTATFTSPQDPGAFVVMPTFFSPALPGQVLFRPPDESAPLNVLFSSTLGGISLAFASNFAPAVTLEVFLGTTLIGSVSSAGTVPSDFVYPEGTLAFSGAVFDNVRLSAAREFAIDNVTVHPASVVPEPATLALVATGLALVGVTGARRKRIVTD